jgi:hypothetical protein
MCYHVGIQQPSAHIFSIQPHPDQEGCDFDAILIKSESHTHTGELGGYLGSREDGSIYMSGDENAHWNRWEKVEGHQESAPGSVAFRNHVHGTYLGLNEEDWYMSADMGGWNSFWFEDGQIRAWNNKRLSLNPEVDETNAMTVAQHIPE